MLLIWEVQSHMLMLTYLVPVIQLSITCHTIWFFLPQTFEPISPHNPYQPYALGESWSEQVYLNTSFCLVLHNTLWSIHQINHQINLILTAPYASLARASKPIPLCTWSLLHGFTFSNHIQYHIRHSSSQAQLLFLPYTVFECRRNIRNQPVSTTIPSPSLFRDITTIRKHQHFGEILKYLFLMFFKTVSHIVKHSTGPLPTLVFIRTQNN